MYTTFQVIHVVAATLWVGGAVFHLFASAQLVGSPPAVMDRWARLGDEAGRRYYSPAAVVTMLAGIGAVAASLGIAVGRIRPTSLAMVDELDTGQPDPARLAELGGRIRVASTLNAAVLLVVVWAMVARPGG